MNELENKIINIASKALLPKQNIINVAGDLNSGFVRIVLDSERNISHKETTHLTKFLNNSIEFDSLFPNGYRLEVTSPGIDSTFQYPFQYKKNIGKIINISFSDNHDNIDLTALISDANNDFVFLKIENEIIKLPYEKIVIAKLKISFNK